MQGATDRQGNENNTFESTRAVVVEVVTVGTIVLVVVVGTAQGSSIPLR